MLTTREPRPCPPLPTSPGVPHAGVDLDDNAGLRDLTDADERSSGSTPARKAVTSAAVNWSWGPVAGPLL